MMQKPTTIRIHLLLGAACFALTVASPLLLTGCPKKSSAPVILNPTTLPPQAKVVATTCPKGQYLRGGEHFWRHNRWNWKDPRCTPKPGSWRDGCVWIRGRWRRQGDRIAFLKGRIRCPGDPEPRLSPPPRFNRPAPRARPDKLPPPPPSGTIGCAPTQYLRVGRYAWREGAWIWVTGRCVQRPASWKKGCRWVRGQWRKTATGLVFTKGRLACP